jgi:hypothetical protein
MIVKEYIPRLSMLLGDKVTIDFENEGFDQVRAILEKVDEDMRI